MTDFKLDRKLKLLRPPGWVRSRETAWVRGGAILCFSLLSYFLTPSFPNLLKRASDSWGWHTKSEEKTEGARSIFTWLVLILGWVFWAWEMFQPAFSMKHFPGYLESSINGLSHQQCPLHGRVHLCPGWSFPYSSGRAFLPLSRGTEQLPTASFR